MDLKQFQKLGYPIWIDHFSKFSQKIDNTCRQDLKHHLVAENNLNFVDFLTELTSHPGIEW